MPKILSSPPSTLSTMHAAVATGGDADATGDADGEDERMNDVAGGNSPFRRFLWLLGYHSNEALTIRAATGIYGAICAQVDTSSLHDVVQMPAVFFSRWHAPLLHAFQTHSDSHLFARTVFWRPEPTNRRLVLRKFAAQGAGTSLSGKSINGSLCCAQEPASAAHLARACALAR